MSNFNKVGTFMKTFGQEVKNKPSFSSDKINKLRIDLIKEELNELQEAMKNNDLLEVADALTDILYVTYGAGHAFGINLDKCFEEVQNSNMSKLGENGQPIYNETDIFNLLLLDVKHIEVPVDLIIQQIDFVIKQLKAHYPKVLLADELDLTPKEVFEEGMRYLGVYNSQKPLYIKSNILKTESLKLLYYYHNQLSSEAVADIVESKEFGLVVDDISAYD